MGMKTFKMFSLILAVIIDPMTASPMLPQTTLIMATIKWQYNKQINS